MAPQSRGLASAMPPKTTSGVNPLVRQLGLAAADCLALEDSAPGCMAALAARLPTVVARSRYTVADVLPAHRLLRADLADLGAVDLAQLRAWHAGRQAG